VGFCVLASQGVFLDGVLAVQAHRRQNKSIARQCSTEETHLGALIATIKPAEEQSVSPMVIMVYVHGRIIHSIPATELSAKMLRKEPMSLNVISHDSGTLLSLLHVRFTSRRTVPTVEPIHPSTRDT
jgi:folate-dependent tRNA-U54 methylase TrmFO/GidA